MSTPESNLGHRADSSTHKSDKPPGQNYMGAGVIALLGAYLVLMSLLVLYGLVKLWPHPTPSGEPKNPLASTVPAPAATPTPTPEPTVTAPTVVTQPARTVMRRDRYGRSVRVTIPAQRTVARAATKPVATPIPSPQPSATPSPAPPTSPLPEPEIITFFGGWLTATVFAERRLLLLVILAGALGSLFHAVRSFYWYSGNRSMVWSWVGYYMLLPFTGSMLALIFYFVVRGGFFSPQASFEATSPFGFTALAALVGLFTPQAVLKLKDVAETVFTKPEQGADPEPQRATDKD